MQLRLLLLAVFWCTVSVRATEHDLRAIVTARERLPASSWTRLLEVQNNNPAGRYPGTVYALIFEFSGLLWFYTPTEGTQSFSLHLNRLEQEKADLAPGLHAIEPGFIAFQELEPGRLVFPLRELPNGCFVQSVAAGWARLSDPEGAVRARLILFYSTRRTKGHCVLAYETDSGVFCIDPSGGGKARRVGASWPQDDESLALAAWPGGHRSDLQRVRGVEFPVHQAPRMQHSYGESGAASAPTA